MFVSKINIFCSKNVTGIFVWKAFTLTDRVDEHLYHARQKQKNE